VYEEGNTYSVIFI